MNGALSVRVETEDGAMRVVRSYTRAPFHYLPVSHRDGGLPVLTLVNSSGGVLGGDVLDVEIALGAGSELAVRAQAATKLYRSKRGEARATCRFELGEGALLDYFPEELIPFAGSDYAQTTRVALAPRAVALVAEIVAAGRLERGERFAFSRLLIEVACAGPHSVTRLHDRSELRPAAADVSADSVLGDATVWGSLYLLTLDETDGALVDRLDECLSSVDGHAGGVSRAPIGLVGRMAGTSVEAIRDAFQSARELALAALRRSSGGNA